MRQSFAEPTPEEKQAYDESPAGQERKRQEQLRSVRLTQTGNDGNGATLIPGTTPPDLGGSQFGPGFGGSLNDDAEYNAEVDRARGMGIAGQERKAVQLDQAQANESRGMQMGGLGYLRNQADGSAPSAAAILGQRANQNAASQAGHAVTGMKGGLGAHLAGQQAASNQAAGQAMGLNAQNAGTRAAEVSRGQQQYASGAQQAQGQDIQAATQNAQYEAQQRAMNEARQQEFERRAWNTRNMQSQGDDRYQRNNDAALNALQQQDFARQQQQAAQDKMLLDVSMTAVNGMTGAGGKTDSDERMKTNVRPLSMGSLGRLMHGGR